MYARPCDDGSYVPDGTIVKYEWDFGCGVSRDHTLTGGVTDYAYEAAYARTAVFRPRGSVANRAIAAILIPNGNKRNEAVFPTRTHSTKEQGGNNERY